MARTTGAGSNSTLNSDDSQDATFVNLRQTACRDLTSVTAHLGQRYSQTVADYQRTLMAVHTEAQNAQEAVARDYMDAMQSTSGTDMSEVVQRWNRALDEARKTAQSRAEGAVEEARRAVDQGIVEANAGWDAACASYIGALKSRIAKIDPASPDPTELAAASEGLGWIAMRVKRKEPS